MSKTAVIIVILVLAVVGSGGGLWYWLNQSNSKPAVSPSEETRLSQTTSSASPSPAKEQTKTYTDPAGFSFSYPESLAVKTAADYDEKTDYAKLVVLGTDGQLDIRASDTKQKKIADWLAKDNQAPKGATLTGATSLGDVSAEQYSDQKNLYTLAIDQGILYMITSPNDREWEKVHETVVSSFRFEDQKSTSTNSGGAGGDDTIYEEEDVVE